MLQDMADQPQQFGSDGKFYAAGLSVENLSVAFNSLAASLSTTRMELTALGGSSQRMVRDVRREARNTTDETSLSTNWESYYLGQEAKDGSSDGEIEGKCTWSVEKREWISAYPHLSHRLAVGVVLRTRFFGEGAERLVRKFREFDSRGIFIGPLLVAKESRCAEIANMKDFHRTFCDTQHGVSSCFVTASV